MYLKSVNSSTFYRVCSRKSLRNYMLIAIPSRPDYLRLVNRCSVARTFIRILIKFHSPVILVLLIILREINLPSPSCLQFSGMIIIQWILTNSFYLTSSLSRTHIFILLLFIMYLIYLYSRRLERYLKHSYSRALFNLVTQDLLKVIMIRPLFLRPTCQ